MVLKVGDHVQPKPGFEYVADGGSASRYVPIGTITRVQQFGLGQLVWIDDIRRPFLSSYFEPAHPTAPLKRTRPRSPDLQSLVHAYGGYDKITPEAWEDWDRRVAAWREDVLGRP